MVVNRIADVGLALGISAIFQIFKTVDYLVVFALTSKAINTRFCFLCFDIDALTLTSLLLFFGVLGKSAQIGLHL
jgi:NADH-quinone oxidoreductase subunit L